MVKIDASFPQKVYVAFTGNFVFLTIIRKHFHLDRFHHVWCQGATAQFVNVNLVAIGAFRDVSIVTSQVIVIFVITVAAAEVGLALAIIMRLYRRHGSVNVDEINRLKG